VLNFSYTTSVSHSSDVEQYGGNYLIPLYGLGASLSFYYVKSDVNSGQVAGVFDVSGSGNFAGVTFSYSLPRWNSLTPSLSVSLEDHYFNNSVKFQGSSVFDPVRSRPLSVRLQARQENPWGTVSGYVEAVENIVSGSNNNDYAYANSGNGAPTSDWNALRFGADLGARLPGDWRLLGRLRGQSSTHALIAGEQFGVGGAWSVRGFQERALAGDSGYFMSAETLTPALFSGFRAAGFVDIGGVVNHDPDGRIANPSQRTVSSAGIGFRYQDTRGIEARADLAHVIRGATDVQATGSWRGHVSMICRF